MGRGVFCIYVVDVVGAYEFYACFSGHADEGGVYFFLLGDSVVLEFEEEVVFSEDVS